jgi:hypothetical protein
LFNIKQLQIMRKVKIFLLVSSLVFGFTALYAQETEKQKEENKKLVLKIYGFLKGDMVYASGGVKSFGNAGSLAAPQQATGVEQNAVGFTAQHTRFGFKGTTGDQVKVGGLLELDFFTGVFESNLRPRMRQGYVSISHGGFEARMGQQWDLFSPNNPNTNNTNGNFWYAGNRGFRRAQLQLSYTHANEKFSPMVQLSLGETTPDGAFPGSDNISGIPMVQTRLSGKFMNKYIVGASFVYGTYLALPNDPDEFTVNTTGISVDFNLPLHKYFSLLGEFSSGTNLSNANLYSIAGSHSLTLAGNDTKTLGYWLNATSNVTDWFTFVLGYGTDKNTTNSLADETIEANTILYTHFVFPIKHGFAVAIEWQNIITARKNADDFKANVIGLSGKVTF